MKTYFLMSKLSTNNPLVSVRNLSVSFKNGNAVIPVLHNISYQIKHNELLAVVGESGSGKSVTAKVLMGLLPKTAQINADELLVIDQPVLSYDGGEWSRFRGSEIAMIFQEPMSSLNPTITCGNQVAEILKQHIARFITRTIHCRSCAGHVSGNNCGTRNARRFVQQSARAIY